MTQQRMIYTKLWDQDRGKQTRRRWRFKSARNRSQISVFDILDGTTRKVSCGPRRSESANLRFQSVHIAVVLENSNYRSHRRCYMSCIWVPKRVPRIGKPSRYTRAQTLVS